VNSIAIDTTVKRSKTKFTDLFLRKLKKIPTSLHVRKKKQVLGLLGVSISFVGVLMLTGIVWWSFLFNDGFFAVTCMRFNEGLLEFVVLPVLCVLCVYGIYRYYNDVIKEGLTREKK